MVGVGGVIIEDGQALLIRRGSEPLRGEWSIPGGTLELGETLEEGVARELLAVLPEDAEVRDWTLSHANFFRAVAIEKRMMFLILTLIVAVAAFDRIYPPDAASAEVEKKRPLFHYVIVDYLCERIDGTAVAGSDVTHVAFAREDELGNYRLTETAMRILGKAFAMDRARRAAAG